MAIASVITCSCKPLSPPPPTFSHFPTHRLSSPKFPPFSNPPVLRFSGELAFRRSGRATSTVVTRAGPSTSTFVFAFIFPLSLLAVTIFTAMRIGDRLDKKFLEELAINQAIREMDDDEDEKGDMFIPREEEPALPRTRSRPKRQV